MPIAVVTDSTAHLPEGFADRHAIRVVPLHVLIDDVTALDGVDIGPAAVADALGNRRVVTTSRPTPAEFTETFHAALDEGADGIVAVHMSSDLSGTWESAVLAAGTVAPGLVRVVDSRTTAMGLGFAALHAARTAADGAALDEVQRAAVVAAGQSTTLFAVETLEHLHRGGRIGSAAAFVGSALAMKPILGVADGRIQPVDKVRTMGRSLTRLVELGSQAARTRSTELAVHHLASPKRAMDLASRLEARLPDSQECVVSELGAVIGAHTGPGVLGVVVRSG